MKNLVSLAALFLVGMTLKAQVLSPQDDGLIPKSELHTGQARVIPYAHLRQDDMLWSRRNWERIHTLEKLNHPLYYPIQALPDRKSLFDVMKDAILSEGSITEVYDDDLFMRPLTMSEVGNRLFRIDTLRDNDDRTIILAIDSIIVKSAGILAWDIKSDWYFDKQRGELKNRIIGISPVTKDFKDGELINLFWVWFPDARQAFSTNVAYNPNNNTRRLTFDQIFQMRYFNAIVMKEDNVYDREIKDYKANNPMEQLLESKRIREEIRNREHDYWQF